jgi:hypothetical protein
MERICQNCVHWVGYDQPIETASRGECLCSAVLDAVRTEATFVVVTAFDWECKGFLEPPPATDDCQQSGGE